jgi:DNA topoisomerase I
LKPAPRIIRLRHASDCLAGFTREWSGRAFRYRDSTGRLIRREVVLERIRRIVVPPAWESVWICPYENGHIQATGRDARGRKQYRYHPAWAERRAGEKFTRMAEFGRVLPLIREKVRTDLLRPNLPREKVLAAVVQLLDRTALRVGNAEYVRANHSFGLSTLRNRHVAIEGKSLLIRFRGKSGIWQARRVTDTLLARIVRRCRDLPGQELFQYLGANGRPHHIGSTDVNGYIRRVAGADYTAKDFRTWAGTVKAAALLSVLPSPATESEAKRAIVEVVQRVANELGNTPAVCRKSYIHPAVIDAFAHGGFPSARRRRGLPHEEALVLKILSAQ